MIKVSLQFVPTRVSSSRVTKKNFKKSLLEKSVFVILNREGNIYVYKYLN